MLFVERANAQPRQVGRDRATPLDLSGNRRVNFRRPAPQRNVVFTGLGDTNGPIPVAVEAALDRLLPPLLRTVPFEAGQRGRILPRIANNDFGGVIEIARQRVPPCVVPAEQAGHDVGMRISNVVVLSRIVSQAIQFDRRLVAFGQAVAQDQSPGPLHHAGEAILFRVGQFLVVCNQHAIGIDRRRAGQRLRKLRPS